MLLACPGASSLDSPMATSFIRDDLFRACSGSDHAEAMSRAACTSDCTPVNVVAGAASLVPFLFDPAAALARYPPRRLNSKW